MAAQPESQNGKQAKAESIAIIGAGMSGLTCARELSGLGFQVHVYDKGRGVSGRMSLRRVLPEHGLPSFQFDHGAQYFTARSPEFQKQVQDWLDREVVAEWNGPFVSISNGTVGPDPGGNDPRYVGVPGMNQVCRDLAEEVCVTCGIRVTGLEKTDEGWQLSAETSATKEPLTLDSTFDAVICTIPASQAKELLPDGVSFHRDLEAVKIAPCRAAMVTFAEKLDVGFGGAFVQNSILRWIAREPTKPGRSDSENWVLHASPEWSAEHLEDDNETAAKHLLGALAEVLGRPLPETQQLSAHSWHFAIPENPLEREALIDRERKLLACGDWCAQSRVEGAFQSGLAAARDVAAMFG